MDIFTAKFITPDTAKDAKLSKGKLLRNTFNLDKEISHATVYVTALGLYELYINGEKVGDAVLTPGWTEYGKRILYQTWDVTPMLHYGENAVGAVLGPGWFKGDLGWKSLRNGLALRNVYGKKSALFMQMDVHFKDGNRISIVTDDTWKYSDGPIQYSELYHGETYDARQEKTNWSNPGYDDSDWLCAEIINHDSSLLVPQDGPLIKKQEIIKAKRLFVTPKGERILDFGQNLTGWIRFNVRGNCGNVVLLRHAEVLDSEGNFYTDNLRSARCEIKYILRGGEPETFQPHFTFQGFRYACIDMWPDSSEPYIENFEAIVVHSEMKQTGHFECSNPLLNQLHHNILWGLKGNFLDVPTDCPQRDERMGWTGDAQVFIRTSTYIMDTKDFFIKWLRDLRASQFENGGVPFVVPDVLTGNFGDGDIIANAESVAGWGDAAVICPWTLWLAYGDVQVLRECYDSMKAWVEYIHRRASDGLLWDTDYQLGDWVALDAKEGSYFGATATDLIATAYYAKCTEILSKTADILGYKKDHSIYKQLLTDIKEAYANEFFSHTGRLCNNTQTAHILSLAFDLTPKEFKHRTIQGLLKLLKENNGHLTTGFLGTPYFCQVLADNGCIDEAYDLLLKKDYPSWLYQITKGATTVWEHWDGIKPDGTMWSANMNSFNHYAYGSVGEFLYRVIAGIDTDPNQTGYKHLIIRPQPGGGLTYVKASVDTPNGTASVSWTIKSGCFMLNTVVPSDSTATIILPDGTTHEVSSGEFNYKC